MKSEWIGLVQDLETAFFLPEDPRLVESLRELRTLDITSGLWAEVSGIRDPRLLELWSQWHMPSAAVAALALTPLVLSIWADQSVTPLERREALDTLKDTFFFATIVKDMVNAWLDRSPGETLHFTWAALVRALSLAVEPRDRKLLADELLWTSRALSHRGPEEKQVFDRLVQAFRP